jgi:hypothetical protein
MAALLHRLAVCLLVPVAAFIAANATPTQAQTQPQSQPQQQAAPPPAYVVVSPSRVTIQVGESRSFRLVDQHGQMQHDVEWSISIPGDFILQQSDEVWITPKDHGHYTLHGVSAAGSADAEVTVVDHALNFGDVIWGDSNIPGCTIQKMMQAMPTPYGPSLYTVSQCADGTYVTAYTADGMQMWRRRIGSSALPTMPAGTTVNPDTVAHLNTHSGSVCEGVTVGMEQQKVHDLLDASHLTFQEGAQGTHEWIVEEHGAECDIWFDAAQHVSKKRKTLVEQ